MPADTAVLVDGVLRARVVAIDLSTATVAEMEQAVKALKVAARVAECREYGHARGELYVMFEDGDPLSPPLPTDRRPPAGVICFNCGATWKLAD